MISEAQRAAILDDLMDEIEGSALDHEIAYNHRVTPAVVRRLRACMRRDLGVIRILTRARYLAQLTQWDGTFVELAVRVMDSAIARAEKQRTALEQPKMTRPSGRAVIGSHVHASTADGPRPGVPSSETGSGKTTALGGFRLVVGGDVHT